METIEIRTRSLTWSGGIQLGAHNYIVYTSQQNGQTVQRVFSAYPDHKSTIIAPWGSLTAVIEDYRPGAYDWQSSGYQSTTVASGPNLSAQWSAIVQCAATINASNLLYQPLGQNSNSAVAQCLQNAGITVPDGLEAFTNGLWTPSDGDGLFTNPVETNILSPSLGIGGPRGGFSGIGGGGIRIPSIPSGKWVYAEVDNGGSVTGGWRWIEYSFASRIQPIVLDLDGDGLELRSITEGVQYDWNGDGYLHATGWIKGGDGFLVFDANSNNTVDNGTELAMTLFNPSALTDLEALKIFDTNQDGILSGADAQYGNFGVWVDANDNALFDAGEFSSFTARGITSIGLSSSGQGQTVALNYVYGSTVASTSVGGQIAAYDVAISAVARGSKDLGAFSTNYGTLNWRALEVSTGELVVSYTGSLLGPGGNVTVNVDSVTFNGRLPSAVLTGSGNDNIYVGGYRDVNGVYVDGPRTQGILIETGDGSDFVSILSTTNNFISTGAGADTVHGGSGDDVITLGTSPIGPFIGSGDYATGGAGNDMYRVQRDSSVTIYDAAGNNDALVVLDVLRSEVSLSRSSNDLNVQSSDGRFFVKVQNYFTSAGVIESIVFEDAHLHTDDVTNLLGELSNAATAIELDASQMRSVREMMLDSFAIA